MKTSKRKKKKKERQLLLRIGQLYLAFFIIWVILRFLVQDAVWWVALLNTYPFLVTLPALLLAIFLFLKKHRRLALSFVVLIGGVFILNYGRLFWPNGVSQADNGRSLTTMTYNIKFNNENDAAMLNAIRQADADVVGLQEVLLDHTTLFEEELADLYPHRLFAEPEFRTDVALLSKYPIIEVKPFVLLPRRMSMHAVLDVEGTPLHVIVVHLTPTQLGSLDGQALNLRVRERYTMRKIEVTGLILEIQNIDDPVLLLCDCNFAETSEVYRQLDTHLDEVHGEIGWGFGKGNGVPVAYQRVDYIWYANGVVPTAVQFSDPALSDHKPILATMRLPE